MSGVLSPFGARVPMGTSLLGALDGVLRTAAWRGVTFHMVDSSDEAGRRWVQFLFPGRDTAQQEDLGALVGDITVSGLLIGEDYIRRADRLRRAFLAAGPGTLIHPWRGEMQVILASPGRIRFDHQQLRCARFEATFRAYDPPQTAAQDTLSRLVGAVDDLLDEGRMLLASVLSPLALPLGLLSWVDGLLGRVGAGWTTLTAGGGGSIAFRAAVEPGVAEMATPLVRDNGYPDAVWDLLAAPAAAVADASAPLLEPAVASASQPYGVASSSLTSAGVGTTALSSPQPPDPRAAAELLLAASVPGSAELAAPSALRAVALAPRLIAVSEAVRAAVDIDYESRQEAIAWRDRLDAALAGVEGELAAIAASRPLVAGSAWRAAGIARRALAADIHERIGRLPVVGTLETSTTLSAWLIAQRIAGDDPARVTTVMLDLVRRNGVRHPSMVPAGTVEYLP